MRGNKRANVSIAVDLSEIPGSAAAVSTAAKTVIAPIATKRGTAIIAAIVWITRMINARIAAIVWSSAVIATTAVMAAAKRAITFARAATKYALSVLRTKYAPIAVNTAVIARNRCLVGAIPASWAAAVPLFAKAATMPAANVPIFVMTADCALTTIAVNAKTSVAAAEKRVKTFVTVAESSAPSALPKRSARSAANTAPIA